MEGFDRTVDLTLKDGAPLLFGDPLLGLRSEGVLVFLFEAADLAFQDGHHDVAELEGQSPEGNFAGITNGAVTLSILLSFV